MSHANAALTPRARLRLARLIVEHGWPIARAAERYRRVLADREAVGRPLPALGAGRDERPVLAPAPVSRAGPRQPVVRKIVHLRWKQRLGPVADRRPARDAGLDGARGAGPVPAQPAQPTSTGPPASRSAATSTTTPGDLIHVDVKKLGNIPDGGGWRYVGRQQGDRNRAAHPGQAPRSTHRNPQDRAPRSCTPSSTTTPGSPTPRSTTTRPPPPPPPCCAARSPGSPTAASPSSGCCPTTAAAYRSHLWRDTCAELGITPKTDPALPAPDQRQDRTLPPHPGRRLGLQEALHLRISPPRSPASMAPRVQPPPAPHRDRQTPTHHPLDQRPRAVHLAQFRDLGSGVGRRFGVPVLDGSLDVSHGPSGQFPPSRQVGTSHGLGDRPGLSIVDARVLARPLAEDLVALEQLPP